MNDINRIVLAEDDREIATALATFFTRLGGYEVATTHRGSEVMELLAKTRAAWVILDLELDDGMAVPLVPQIREAYGADVFLLILTGYWETYTENMLFWKGADDVLRKPHRPQDIYARMQRMAERYDGGAKALKKILALRMGNARLNLGKGVLTRGEQRLVLPDSCLKLLVLMAQWDGDGWQLFPRGDLLVNLWGASVTDDPPAYSDRLRALIYRIRGLVGFEAIEYHRGRNNSSLYCLSHQVTIDEATPGEGPHAPASASL